MSAGLTIVGSDAVPCRPMNHWHTIAPYCSTMHGLGAVLMSARHRCRPRCD